MTLVDVGCGLGFLGKNYWKYFGDGGHYIGVDISTELLEQARDEADQWSEGGKVTFMAGDAYELPLPDDYCDAAICQTLLMHLQEPEKALSQMIRIVKPGGVVICQEPDNLAPQLMPRHWSLPEDTIDELLLKTKVAVLSNKGLIKLGLGDNSIGGKVYHMLRELGLENVDVRTAEYVPHLHPPYSGDQIKVQLEMVRKQVLNEERQKQLSEREREGFLAGGGTSEEWKKYCAHSDRIVAALKEQIDNESYYFCGAYPHYFTRGYKPSD
jgi:SAM-dependent methyltransferase